MNTTGPEIASRIKKLCDAHGVPVKHFEQECGLSNGYLRKLSVQGSIPSADRLGKIAEYFNVSTGFLLGATQYGQRSDGVMIPLLGRVAAGIPIEAAENVIGYEEITNELAATGDFFALLIKGNSMAPFILDGDKVVVRRQEDADNGDIVIALINEQDGVCKALKKTDHGLMLISKNPEYDPLVFTHSEIDSEPVKIIGRVLEIRRAL